MRILPATLVLPLAAALAVLTACPTYSDEPAATYDEEASISWGSDICSFSGGITTTDPDGNIDDLELIGCFANLSTILGDSMLIALLPANVSGSFADPGQGWLVVRLGSNDCEGCEGYDGESATGAGDYLITGTYELAGRQELGTIQSAYVIENTEETYRETVPSGVLSVSDYTVTIGTEKLDPDDNAIDNGGFTFGADFTGITMDIDGVSHTLEGSVSASAFIAGPVGGGGDADRFTCDGKDTLNQCVEYTVYSESKASELRSQCGGNFSLREGHSCPSGGLKCQHSTAEATSLTHTWEESSASHDSRCVDTEGTVL